MRKGRVFFFLALILLLGLVAVAVVYYQYLLPAQASNVNQVQPTPVIDLVDVVVVTQKVPRGTLLSETVLGMVEIPREVFIDGYFSDMSGVVGRQARVDLEANMLLTTSMVVESSNQLSSTGSLAALTIPKGMVAVSIPINRLSSVSYAPQSGDHVNVITTMLMVDLDNEYQSILPNYNAAVTGAGSDNLLLGSTSEEGSIASETENKDTVSADSLIASGENMGRITAQSVAAGSASVVGRTEFDPVLEQTFYIVPSERQRPRMVSQTLLQDAIVLHVGDFSTSAEEEEPQVAAGETIPEEGEIVEGEFQQVETQPTEPKLPDVITLIVTPQDAVTLNYLVYSGAQLTLALRSANDDTLVQTEAATLDYLLTQYNVPVPVKLPYGMETRIDELNPPQLTNDIVEAPQE